MVLDKSSFGYQCHIGGKQINIGVLASGNGTNFEVIQQNILNRKINGRIRLVICNIPDAPVISKAKSFNRRTLELYHQSYNDREGFDTEVVEALQYFEIDLVVMAGWMRISTNKLIEPFENRIINLHPSLLPEFKGNNAINQVCGAFQANEITESGATVHLVTPELDSGPIIQQDRFIIRPGYTITDITRETRKIEYEILTKAIRMFVKT